MLLRQILGAFDAREKGELVSRAETAEAALERPRATPQSSSFNQSHFAYGAPRAVPSNLVDAIDKDPFLKRFAMPIAVKLDELSARIENAAPKSKENEPPRVFPPLGNMPPDEAETGDPERDEAPGDGKKKRRKKRNSRSLPGQSSGWKP